MNREIKFRAWCDTKKEFVNPTYHNATLSNLFKLRFYKFQQFTGLTDKNGKEIYDGDIVKATHYNFNHPDTIKTQLVYFEDGCFCLKSVGNEIINPLQEDRNNVPIFWLQSPSSMEVIGNIHENPELLNN